MVAAATYARRYLTERKLPDSGLFHMVLVLPLPRHTVVFRHMICIPYALLLSN